MTIENLLSNCSDKELDKILEAACTITQILQKNAPISSTELMIQSETYRNNTFLQICAFDAIRTRERA